MKSRVELSIYSSAITIVVIGLLLFGIYATSDNPDRCMLIAFITVAILAFAMFYCPLYISANEEELRVKSPLRSHKIPMRRIVNVGRFQPTMGSIHICGSGGFMGYWGMFREGDVGRYMAFYGKSSDCFIIRLDNGDKYVLGCGNPDAFVKYINLQICK